MTSEMELAPPPPMPADEAHERLDRVRGHVSAAREDLTALYVGRAWLALGFASWDELCDAHLGARIALPRSERREAVTEMRQAGMSTRAIGSALGVDQKTISNDLRSEELSSVEQPARVISLDGRERPAVAFREPAPMAREIDSERLAVLRRAEDERARLENLTQRHTAIARSVTTLLQFTEPEARRRFIADWDANLCDANPADMTVPALDDLAVALRQLAEEWASV